MSRISEIIAKRPIAFTLATGVLGSIIFSLLLEPITELVRATLFAIVKSGVFAAADSIYARAAGDPLGQAFGLLLFIVSGAAIGAAGTAYYYARTVTAKAVNLGARVALATSDVPTETPKPSPEHFQREVRSLVKRAKGNELIFLAFYVALGLTLAREIVVGITALAILNGFEERMEILSPVLPPAEVSSIYNDWNKVRGVSDFKRLAIRIEGLAKERGVVLPFKDMSPSLAAERKAR